MTRGCQIGLPGTLTLYCWALWLRPFPHCPPSSVHQQGYWVEMGSRGGDAGKGELQQEPLCSVDRCPAFLFSPAFPPWGCGSGFRVPGSLVTGKSRRGLSAPVSRMEVAIYIWKMLYTSGTACIWKFINSASCSQPLSCILKLLVCIFIKP